MIVKGWNDFWLDYKKMVSKVLLGLILVLFDKKEYLINIFYFVDLVV